MLTNTASQTGNGVLFYFAVATALYGLQLVSERRPFLGHFGQMASENAPHLPVDTTRAVPSKSILKKHHSHDCQDPEGHRRAQWDEMNILATYHPKDKDYGHMKIDDPPTPYHEYQEPDDSAEAMDSSGSSNTGESLRERKASFSDTRVEVLDEDIIARKLAEQAGSERVRKISVSSTDPDDESQLSDEQLQKKREFEKRRKQHYNEFQQVKMARKLLEQEDDEEDSDSPTADRNQPMVE